jgi:hypothetical protein
LLLIGTKHAQDISRSIAATRIRTAAMGIASIRGHGRMSGGLALDFIVVLEKSFEVERTPHSSLTSFQRRPGIGNEADVVDSDRSGI